MSMPFYVAPEQLMKDRADYARKGIARGRSVVVIGYDDGIAFATQNPSRSLHKISEIYDRIGFAAVGKYNEFENLRVAGVRYADLRGYSYDRADVSARGLANAYAQTLGTVFTTEAKPLEVELVVAEVGREQAEDQIFRLSYDGSVADESGFVVIGGQAEDLGEQVEAGWTPKMTLPDVLAMARTVLSSANIAHTSGMSASHGASVEHPSDDAAVVPELDASQLEVAVLDRTRARRTFKRLSGPILADLLSH